MSHLIVNGGRPLRGSVKPSANKNAVLPVLCATLLTEAPVTLHRVPDITDVRKLLEFFRALGSTVEMDFATGTLKLQHAGGIDASRVPLPARMRSSAKRWNRATALRRRLTVMLSGTFERMGARIARERKRLSHPLDASVKTLYSPHLRCSDLLE